MPPGRLRSRGIALSSTEVSRSSIAEARMSDAGRSPPTSGAERRASVRQHFEWDMACELTSYGESARWPAEVCDISVDGIGLLLERSFPPGAVLEIELSSRDGSLSYVVVARV